MDYYVYDSDTGEILSVGQCPDDMVALQSSGTRVAVAGAADQITQRVVNGILTNLPPDVIARRRARPRHFARWDWPTLDWVDLRDLSEQKVAKWAEIKGAAQAAALGGFTAGGFTWDSDLATQQRMQLTWQDMKEADGPTSVAWYTADGAPRTLTANQFKNLARALRQHLAAQQDKAATLRAQIQAAATAAEVAAIVWT